MYGMVLSGAWLLSVSETAIEVLHHPSETFEFDSVVKLVQQYGKQAAHAVLENALTFLKRQKKLPERNRSRRFRMPNRSVRVLFLTSLSSRHAREIHCQNLRTASLTPLS